MSNNYFEFKQFTILQQHSSMKVTTDACLLGGWTPVTKLVHRVLDIGTGTGLLSLMLAQRTPEATFDGIELDPLAAAEADGNVKRSPWADRITIIEGDAKSFRASQPYDLIICNPPFFNNSLLSGNNKKDAARHTTTLSYQELISTIKNNLKENGYAAILLPISEQALFEKEVTAQQMVIYHKHTIKHTTLSKPKRIINLISYGPYNGIAASEMIIYNNTNEYTKEFTSLLQPYYLYL
jgi:tRNA1Val (adenine37-N6)-methyltransferase